MTCLAELRVRCRKWVTLTMAALAPVWCLAAEEEIDLEATVSLFELVIDADEESARQCLSILAEQTQSGEVSAKQAAALKQRLRGAFRPILADEKHPLFFQTAVLAASWQDQRGVTAMLQAAADVRLASERRLQAIDALIAAEERRLLGVVANMLTPADQNPLELRGKLLASLGRVNDPELARIVLTAYPQLEPTLQPRAVELLTQRNSWSRYLLTAIREDRVPASSLNVNQLRKLVSGGDPQIAKLVEQQWGAIRADRNQQREQVVQQMRMLMATKAGDPHRGRKIFQRVCGQCHKIYGEGQSVGPEITSNGRASFEQLMSNIFDPSLVIGASYQARMLITLDGRVLTGLLVEDSPQRIVLKMQGGKQEIVARDDVEELHVSRLSLMPEGLESQLQPQEIQDLLEFLLLDRPPTDPQARYLPGTPTGPRQ